MLELRSLRGQLTTTLIEEKTKQRIEYQDYLLAFEEIRHLRKRNKQLEQEKHSYARSIIKINSEIILDNEFLKERIEVLEANLQKATAEIKRLYTLNNRNAEENSVLFSQLINLKICLNQERFNKLIVERSFEQAKSSLGDLDRELQLIKSNLGQIEFGRLSSQLISHSNSNATLKDDFKPFTFNREINSGLIEVEKEQFFDCARNEESSTKIPSHPNDFVGTS
jgi:hypothetical protein